MNEFFNRLFTKGEVAYINFLRERIESKKKLIIITANTEIFISGLDDEKIRNMLLDEKVSIVPDGISLVHYAKKYNIEIEERIPGVDLCINLFRIAQNLKLKLFLYGSKREVIKKTVDSIKKQYPNIKIVGAINGFENNKKAVVQKIKKAKPDICLVALGCPKQEKFIYKNLEPLKSGIFIGVGGSLDVISGYKRRAPKILIKLHLEWLYRIIREPKRIQRFVNYNLRFIRQVRKDNKLI